MNERLPAIFAWICVAITTGFTVAVLALSFDILRPNPSVLTNPLNGLITGLIGGFIALKRRHNWIGWVLLVISLSLTVGGFAEVYTVRALPQGLDVVPGAVFSLWVAQSRWIGLFIGLTLMFHLFPTGAPLNRRWRAVLLGSLFVQLAVLVLFAVSSPMTLVVPNQTLIQEPNPFGLVTFRADSLSFLLLILPTILALVAMIVRFVRARGIERQQMKWFLFAATLFVVTVVISSASRHPTTELFITIVALGMPITVGIALFRYRLYDIDVLIRRTLTYAILSAFLALIYFGSIVALQRVFSILTGVEQNEIVTVLSTLAIAALFVPLRSKIQQLIDQRFYRKKYDAQKVLADFANTLRDETDLENLTGRLVQVVNETMQPKSVSVWLKQNGEK